MRIYHNTGSTPFDISTIEGIDRSPDTLWVYHSGESTPFAISDIEKVDFFISFYSDTSKPVDDLDELGNIVRVFQLLLNNRIPVISPGQYYVERESLSEQPKTWTLHAGYGSPKAWNFIGITKEYMLIDDHVTVFLTGGSGTILIGAGLALYSNYDGTGVICSAAGGMMGGHANLSAQLKFGRFSFLTIGCSYGKFVFDQEGFLPVAAYEYRFK